MIPGASCLGCRKAQLGDWAVDQIIAAEIDVAKPVTDAAIRRAAEQLAAAEDRGRVQHFDPVRAQHPNLMPEYALHEAAHAVVGLLLGKAVRHVNIDGGVSCAFDQEPRLGPLDDAVVSLAGHAVVQRFQAIRSRFPANTRFCAARGKEQSPDHSCDACRAFRNIGAAMPEASIAEMLDAFYAIEDRAIGIVRRPNVWAAIEAVASALVERGHLNGEEVEALVAPFALRNSVLLGGAGRTAAAASSNPSRRPQP